MIYDDLITELESQQHRDDGMSIQTDRLLLDAAETIRLLRQSWDGKCVEANDLRAKLAAVVKVVDDKLTQYREIDESKSGLTELGHHARIAIRALRSDIEYVLSDDLGGK